MHEAIKYLLENYSSTQQLTIIDQHACFGGEKVKLSKLQAVYLDMLAKQPRQSVSHAKLRESGITAPTDLKHDLIRKFAKKGIDVKIVTPPGAGSDTLVSVGFVPITS